MEKSKIELHQKKAVIQPSKPAPEVAAPKSVKYSPPARNQIKINEEVVKPSTIAISSSKAVSTKKYSPPAKVVPQEKKEVSLSKSNRSKPKSEIDLLSQPKESKIVDTKSAASNNKKSYLTPSKPQLN